MSDSGPKKTIESDSGPTKKIEILVVEDNPEFADWTVDELRKIPGTGVSLVEDGVEALAFLRRERKYVTAVRPHLILLDMRLPKKSGWDVLEEMHFGDAGDDAHHDIFDARLSGGSHRHRVAVAPQSGGQPKHVDLFRLNLAGIRDDCFCHGTSSDRQRKLRPQLYGAKLYTVSLTACYLCT